MTERICIAIQARMSSSRLPGKVLMELDGVRVIDRVIASVNEAIDSTDIFVLTSTEASDDVLAAYLKEKGINVFRGSLDNVLQRFIDFVREHREEYDFVGRVCADSPFVDKRIIHSVHSMASNEFDIITTRYFENGKILSNVPKGKNYEIILCESLVNINVDETSNYAREHVIPTFFDNGYVVKSVNEAYFSNLKADCAIDTKEDLERWNKI